MAQFLGGTSELLAAPAASDFCPGGGVGTEIPTQIRLRICRRVIFVLAYGIIGRERTSLTLLRKNFTVSLERPVKRIISLAFVAMASVIFLSAISRQALAESKSYCLVHFNLAKVKNQTAGLPREERTKWNQVKSASIEYAMCRAMSDRNPDSCDILNVYSNKWSQLCRDNFSTLIFSRDIGKGITPDTLDALDYQRCAAITHSPVDSPTSRAFCRGSAQEFSSRRNVCAVMKYVVSPDQLYSAVRKCRESLNHFSPVHNPPDLSDTSTAIASYFWMKKRPNCGRAPVFNSPLTRGACLGTFYGESACARILGRIKTMYCSAIGAN
ncbi:MAG TPA: hypothetical protein VNK24_08670 [Elusimicrobiota bacterium]|nr:hypothetical protein [Elusimicrobiota bacterium]